MDAFFGSFLAKPYAGAALIIIGLAFAFGSGWSKAHDFYKLDYQVRFTSSQLQVFPYIISIFGAVLLVISNFGN